MYEPKIRNQGIKVEKRKKRIGRSGTFEGDIRQVLNNLIGNATDAMKSGGKTCGREPRSHALEHGPQRPRSNRSRYRNRDTTRSRKQSLRAFLHHKGELGSGLGLWISKEIVDRHHGSLRMRSSQREAQPRHRIYLFLPFDTSTHVNPV